jgi:flagellar biosynthesis/type III secretory pathway protein FliH
MRRDDQAEPEEPEEDLEYEDDAAIRLEDGGLVTDEADDFGEEAEGEADAPVEFAGPADEVASKPPPEPLADRARALWADILIQARKIELPGAPEAGRQRTLTVAAIVLASLVAGVGAYLLANSTGTDVEQARLEGQVAGRAAGAIEGASQGYSAGFQKGRLRGFRKAYVPAYRIYYKRAFEQAGLDPPSNEQFDVPVP